MDRPVIILSFSSAGGEEHLPMINRERKNVYRTLRRHNDKGLIQVEKEASTSIEDIFELFRHYDNRIAIFHFGGHAGDKFLQMEDADNDKQLANSKGLAQLIGRQENLKLVFLNGCATKGQVDLLLAQGVDAVIATSVPVADQMATEFAEQFYRSLASHTTIQRAYDDAKSFIETKYKNPPKLSDARGIKIKENKEEKVFPWGLYHNGDVESVLAWKLPSRPPVQAKQPDHQANVNDIFIATVCEELAKYSDDLLSALSKNNLNAIRREIIDCFPIPIGEQVRKLFSRSEDRSRPGDMEQFSSRRLEQLIFTYRTTAQFICYILLSQLWDEKLKNPELSVKEDYIVDFNSFFNINEVNFESFDYVKLTKAITDIFDDKNIPYFIEEIAQVKIDADEDVLLYNAYLFMNNMHQDIRDDNVDASNLENLCKEAEEHLGVILSSFAFLVKYRLVTIKGIQLEKERHESPKFIHQKVPLTKALTAALFGLEAESVTMESFTDNKSVLFIKRENEKLKGYLNLIPFVIDENALNNHDSSRLFLFGYQTKDGFCFFRNLDHEESLVVSDKMHPQINKLFYKFQDVVFLAGEKV